MNSQLSAIRSAEAQRFKENTGSGHHVFRLFPVLFLLFCSLLAACASQQPDMTPLEETGISRAKLSPGSSVWVSVAGLNRASCEDLESLITASLQSDRGLSAADDADSADAVIRVTVRDVYLKDTKRGNIRGGEALRNTSIGAMLGLIIGSVASHGHSGSTLLGAGIGAAAGLGATAMDVGTTSVWAMDTEISIAPKGEAPNPELCTVTAEGSNMDRSRAENELKEKLSHTITTAIRIAG